LVALSILAGALAGCQPKQQPAATPTVPPTTSTTSTTAVRFVDVAGQAGLNYQWSIAGSHPYTIRQTIGNGCAFLDYDGDGNLDILLAGDKIALYRGDGHGKFSDVTVQAGLSGLQGNYFGCAVGDYDNDGFPDIYLTAYQGGTLLHNAGGKSFVDVTKGSGLSPQPFASSAAFVDIDGDGKLDLYVGNYVKFDAHTVPQNCSVAGVMGVCPPRVYDPDKGVVYRNAGGGKFVDMTRPWKADSASGKTLGVAFADFDGSGHPSLMLANDEMAGNLMRFDGKSFADVAATAGCAYSANGNVIGGMGVDWGDYDNDGRLDLAVATFQGEIKCVYHNDGKGLFTENSSVIGIGTPTRGNVAFGLKWLDADNDGLLDMMITNGHTRDNVADVDKGTTFRQASQFFHNDGGSHFSDASSALTGDAGAPIVGRGLAIGDFDNDGKMDALAVDIEGHALLLHNETPSTGHWLEVNLVGTKSNRDGQEAMVTATAGSLKILRQCTTSGSYMSASDKRVHLGIGGASTIDTLSVRWPNGHVDTFQGVKADRVVTVTEGQKSTP